VHCGRPVARGQLMAGDLVFFRNNGHVGMYLGGGWFIHAPHTGDVVKISALSARSDISACRRIL
jgi:peptidoglycan DL-endopeptidase CwlO